MEPVSNVPIILINLDTKSRKIGGYWLKNVLCYDNWIETKTKAPTQHIIDEKEINICLEHSSRC